MRYLKWLAIFALACLPVLREGNATAIAGVSVNRFTFLTAYSFIDGVPSAIGLGNLAIELIETSTSLTKTETGNGAIAFSTHSGNTGASIGGQAIAEPGGYAWGSYTVIFTYRFTNVGAFDLPNLTIATDFSSFNPGGLQVGARVDDTALEFARFATSQSGRPISDSHSCDTRLAEHTVPAPPPGAACGVYSPDSSTGELTFGPIAMGQYETRTFALRLELEAFSGEVSEPGSLGLAALGAFAIAYRRRPRRNRYAPAHEAHRRSAPG